MMKNYRKLFTALLFLMFGYGMSIAQSGPAESDSFTDERAVIVGKVISADGNQPLEFAAISLYTKKDSVLVTGGVTNEKGEFSIDANPGSYYAKVEFISFKVTIIEDIVVDEGQRKVDIGTIVLSSDATVLAEVEVRAEKSTMQMSLDKRVFNVGKDLANRGSSVTELLDNVPSVSVDIDGNVSLRGRDNVRILINGKPSGLIGNGDANGLRQLPANMIDRIEVITNPSARYDAAGMTGIINIVLRKENEKGLNGSFDVNAGNPDNFGTAINLNYRQPKLNLFANVGINYRRSPGDRNLYQEFYRNDTTFILVETGDRLRGGLSNTYRFGMDYYFSPKSTLTGAFSLRNSNEDNFSTLTYEDFLYSLDNPTRITRRTDDERETETDLEYSLNYKKTTDRKGEELTLDFQYEENIETETSDFLEQYFASDQSATGKEDLLQRSGNKEAVKRYLIQTDYVLPIGEEGKFETGYRGSIRIIDNSYLVEEFEDNVWQNLVGLSNDFLYNENIHGLYFSLGNKIHKFSYLVGLRGEYSDVRTELVNTKEVNDRNYFNLFPTAHLTYDLAQQNAIQISYSRRINRPRFHDLNPFFSYSNPRNFYGGNPNLDPEFTHSFEIGHIKYWEKASLSSSLYYRYSTGVIERIKTIDEVGNTYTVPMNLATENAYGLEVTYSMTPYKWWRLNGDLNFYRSLTDGNNVGANLSADNLSWFGRMTSMMTIKKKLDFQLRFNYRAAQTTTQGKQKSMSNLDLALSQDILKNKATVTFSVNDLFNSQLRRFISYGDNFFSEGSYRWRRRQIMLSFNYRLNQNKKKGGDRGGREDGGGDFGGGEF
ncbi:MAG: outer membrane beta-barrel family protein [Saprospiraceae bacterium]